VVTISVLRRGGRLSTVPQRRIRLGVVALASGILASAAGCVATPAATPVATPSTPLGSASPSPSTLPTTAMPTSVDGLPVLTVGEALGARAAGGLRSQPVALGGYWSDGSIGHSCAAPRGQPGELEIYCTDGEAGITERDEPIIVIDAHGNVTPAAGPHLTPWIPDAIAVPLFTLPILYGQRYPPVPIVVVGHFDDPRAAQCRPEARQLCADRLVVDRIAAFSPGSVPLPTPTPTPTPFPDPAPSGLFAPSDCSPGVEYSFIGWTTTAELQLPFERPGHVWAVVTATPVPLGVWTDGGNGHQFIWYGRRICIGEEGEPGAMTFGSVPGSAYMLWDDGHKVFATPP
jgi:hypothetical protein